jgi:hypothetical protein
VEESLPLAASQVLAGDGAVQQEGPGRVRVSVQPHAFVAVG